MPMVPNAASAKADSAPVAVATVAAAARAACDAPDNSGVVVTSYSYAASSPGCSLRRQKTPQDQAAGENRANRRTCLV